MVLSLNGLPVATAELKNPFTGQTVQHGLKRYRHDRGPREPLFRFAAGLSAFPARSAAGYSLASGGAQRSAEGDLGQRANNE
jgi:type I site-specific restriction-modification system R (restriction) subunit